MVTVQAASRADLRTRPDTSRRTLTSVGSFWLCVGSLLVGCGGAGAEPAALPTTPSRTLPVPDAESERRAALVAIGRDLHAALGDGQPERVLMDDVTLRAVLDPAAAKRIAALRLGLGVRLGIHRADFSALKTGRFAGLCVQQARLEAAHDALGLKKPSWVFERALVVVENAVGKRLASWVEGQFIYTDAGFRAIDLQRVETPRWEHSDLELAPCDMEVGVRTPLPIGVVTP